MHTSSRIAAVVAAVAASLTYLSWMFPEGLAFIPLRPAIQLIVLFWISMAALLASAFMYRNQGKSTLIFTMLLVAVFLLLRPTFTALEFTAWVFRGLAP